MLGFLSRGPVLPCEPFVDSLQVLVDQIVLQIQGSASHLLGLGVAAVDIVNPVPAHEPDHPARIEAAVPEVETQPRKTGDDPNVIKSEIDDIRKSVVSMSVGQPSRTSTIVKEWLEQPAPTPPEPEPSDDEGDED